MKNKKLVILSILSLFVICSVVTRVQAQVNEISDNITLINKYFSFEKNDVPIARLKALSTDILSGNDTYSVNTRAKLYLLLADNAMIGGDYAQAFDFAEYGLLLPGIDISLRLQLLLKQVAGHYANGKFNLSLQISNQAITLATDPADIKHRLIALSYRAMAYALVAESELASNDLKTVDELISDQPQLLTNLELLNILSAAHFHLNDFKGMVDLQNKILEIKLQKNYFFGLDKTYYNLGLGYSGLKKYDDAYNAYWEAEKISIEKSYPIRLAYTQLGLGEILLLQEKPEAAYQRLKKSEQFFETQYQQSGYLSTLIYLAEAALKTARAQEGEDALFKAEKLAQNMELTSRQIELYYQLHLRYKAQGNYEKSLSYLSLYLDKYKKFTSKDTLLRAEESNSQNTRLQSQLLEERLIENTQLDKNLDKKYYFQQQMIILLISIILILLLLSVVLWLRKRSYQLITQYNDNERPDDYLCSPSQTKNLYQLNYKKARKYGYPLTIGYIMISNWKELNGFVAKKVCDEVARVIATLINQSISEYDYAGKLNEGQYIILCSHQAEDEVVKKLQDITEALEMCFFANLGDFSINIGFSYDTPSAQDIDPYIFLSRLSEKVSAKYSN